MLWNLRQGRVLVAASDGTTRDALAEVLGDEGFTVRTASDASTANAMLAAFRPHLVLADLDLCGGGAARVIEQVARHCPSTQVGLLTNLLELDARRIAHDLGVPTYLNRPLDLGHALRVATYLVAAGCA